MGRKETKYKPEPSIPIPVSSIPKLIARGVNPIGMSYWRNINYHADRNEFLVALSINDQLHILTIDKDGLIVRNNKPLGIAHTGEGIYFSSFRYDILYVPLNGILIIVNVFTGERAVVWEIPDNKLWQCHSSLDETIHSATVRNSDYEAVRWGLSTGQAYLIKGTPDECQIDKSGQWLVVKENNYNRIIRISNGTEFKIENEAGALGHSDCGMGFFLGENDFSDKPGALDLITFSDMNRTNIFSTGIWNMGYVSLTGNYNHCLVSTPTELWKVALDGSGGIKVCNNLTESQDYEHRPKANLCSLGEYAVWTAFVQGKLDCYVVKIL